MNRVLITVFTARAVNTIISRIEVWGVMHKNFASSQKYSFKIYIL